MWSTRNNWSEAYDAPIISHRLGRSKKYNATKLDWSYIGFYATKATAKLSGRWVGRRMVKRCYGQCTSNFSRAVLTLLMMRVHADLSNAGRAC